MSVYYCESCRSEQNEYINTGSLPVVLPGLDINEDFLVGSGFNNDIYSIQLQSDGKILVGGYFDEYSGTSVGQGLIRLESDGSIDTSFDVGNGFYLNLYGIPGYITSIQIQSDGKIIVGGGFDEYSGTSVGQGLIRLNTDGSIDTSFDVGTGFYDQGNIDIGYVNSIQIQSDGKILVGGRFDEYSGTSVGYSLIRLNTDGSIDTSFDVGTGFYNIIFGDLGYIYTIQIQSDGKILVGGFFDEYSGTSVGYSLIRLNTDGSIDTSFDVGTGFNGEVFSIQIQSDGKILVGGQFDDYNGTLVGYGLIRLESDGSIDTSFNVGSGFNNIVRTIELSSDGKILVGGGFTSYNGLLYNRLIRLNTDGSIDTSFVIDSGFNNVVYSINVLPDNTTLVGGSFTTFNGILSQYIVKFGYNDNTSIIYAANFNCYTPLVEVFGNVDPFFNIKSSFNGQVWSIKHQLDGKILVGGSFTSYSGVSKNSIVRLNTDYTIDTTFDIGTGFNDIVYNINTQSDGKILVGGNFTSYGSVSSVRIIRLNTDGSIDNSFVIGTGFNNVVYNINTQSDGKILVSGNFTSYNGEINNRVIRLNSDGSIDSDFYISSGFDNVVYNSKTQPDGRILFGGNFTRYGGFTGGTLNTTFTPSSISTTVNTSLKDSDGNLIVGYTNGFRKVNPSNGSTIYNLGTNGVVNYLENLSDGSVLVSGGFTLFGNLSSNNLVKINAFGNKDTSFGLGDISFNSNVLTTKEQSDGKILVGGSFTSYGINQVDFSFTLGFNSNVFSMVEQSDGKFLLGGSFTSYGGSFYNRIIRLNGDGSVDNSFVIGTGFPTLSSVLTISLQPDGKIIVGGTFTSYNGVSRNRIIRLNTDGSVDTSFIIGTGFNGGINTIQVQPDGKILVGGAFTSYSGISRSNIIRLNTNGSVDTSFVIGTGFNNTVRTIQLQPDGKILVGGDFSSYSGVSRSRIIRLNTDGSIDTSFVIGTGFNSGVRTIQLQSDGKILVGGSFSSYSGVSINNIIRLNSDGSIDTSFVIGTGFNNFLQTIQLLPDGKILAGGTFTSYSGVSINRSILLNTDGSINLSFSLTGSTGGASGTINGFLPKSGFTYVYGEFTSYNGISQLRLSKIRYNYDPGTPIGRYSRLNSDGSVDLTFSAGNGFTNTVNKIDTQPNGKILVAGNFTQYSGISTDKIVRLNTDNTLDETFSTGGIFNGNINTFDVQSDGKLIVGGTFTEFTNNEGFSNLNDPDNTIVLQPDGKILLGGSFTSYGGVSRNRIIRLNSNYTIDTSFVIGTGFNNVVNTIELQPDGKILVGGSFTSYSGVTSVGKVRLNTDGSLDLGFNETQLNGSVVTISTQSDNKILMGGEFNKISSIVIAFNNTVIDSVAQSDGKIILVGDFTNYSGVSRNRIIRLNTDNSVDNTFNIGLGFNLSAYTVSLQSDGKVLVGGDFTSYSGLSINRIIRLNTDGSIDSTFTIGSGFNGLVDVITVQSDGKILAGGNFTNYSGYSSPRVIRLNTDGSVDTTFYVESGFNSTVNDITTQSDGKVVVGGSFTTYGGFISGELNQGFTPSTIPSNVNTTIKDNSGDLIFGYGAGIRKIDPLVGSTIYEVTTNSSVNSLEVLSGTSILVGGDFTTYSGLTNYGLLKIDSSGYKDNTFDIGNGFLGSVRTTQQQSDGKILVGGSFTVFNNQQVDLSFNIGSGFNSDVGTIETQSDGKILVGGNFGTYNGVTSNKIIRLNTDGSVDTSFVIGTGFNGEVRTIKLQSDGKILVGGNFNTYSGVSRNFIIRLNTDGSIDNSFVIGTGFNGSVSTIELQSDGKILVGGYFTSYSGVSRNYIIRLNTDGSIDTSFVIGTGFNSNPFDILSQPDGKILVGGNFTSYSGVSRNWFIRLNSDGSIDNSFVIGTGFNNLVRTIGLQSDNKILVGGWFTSYSGVSRNYIIRLNTDGSVDNSFVIGTGFDQTTEVVVIQPDGKILVGGSFTSYSGVSINRSILLNSDGSIDLSFSITGSTGGANFTVFGFSPRSGFTYVYGSFSRYNTISYPKLVKIFYGYGSQVNVGNYIRLNSNGSYDNTFSTSNIFSEFFGATNVLKINEQTDGKLLVAGNITSYSGIGINRIVRLNSDSTLDQTFSVSKVFNEVITNFDTQSDGKIIVGGNFTQLVNNILFTDTVTVIQLQSDGKILVGGNFSTYNGSNKRWIVRLNSDYSLDESFVIGSGFSNGPFNGYVNSIELQSDGKILVGGQFISYSGVSRNNIIRLNTDGSIDTSFVIGTGFNDTVGPVQLQPDGKIIVGGTFTSYSGVSRNRIIRLNTDGSVDTSFVIGTGFNSNVNTVQLQTDGKILVGGQFTTYSGVSRNYIIRLNTNGSIDTSFVIGTGFNSSVTTIELQPDGKILVGGGFTTYSGVSRNYIIRLNTDGSIDTSFVIGTGFGSIVLTIQLQPNNKILVGGLFTSYSGVSYNRIIRLNTDGSVDTSFVIGTGFPGQVNTIGLQSDGKILAGGYFFSYNGFFARHFISIDTDGSSYGKTLNRIARLNADGTLDPTFNSVSGFNGSVSGVTIQSDGKILVTGNFTSYSGISSNGIARLNSDGLYDPTFVVGTGFNSGATTVTLVSNDYVLAGGNFTSYNGTPTTRLVQLTLSSAPITNANRIIRLNTDGSVDNSFVIGSGFPSSVNTVTIQNDGKILAGGDFTSYSGVSRNRIIRLNTDGSVDTSFVIGTGFNTTVQTIQLQPDGKILVGGFFTSYSGVSRNYIIRLNTDGSIDSSFTVGSGFDNQVYTILQKTDNSILVGGSFTSYDGSSALRMVILNNDGSAFNVFNYGGIVRLNNNGSTDTSFDVGTGFRTFGDVGSIFSIQIQSDGKILVGGYFDEYSGTSVGTSLIRLESDGSIDTSFDVGTGFYNSIYGDLGYIQSIQIQSDGKILVGGGFDEYSGTSVGYSLIRLNTDGSIDTSFDVGTGFYRSIHGELGYIYTIQIQSDGKILVGGEFDDYNGTSVGASLIRLESDGSIDTSFDVGTGFNSQVNTIELQPDGKILVGGVFSSYNGISVAYVVTLSSSGQLLGKKLCNRIARLNIDGTFDTSFNNGIGFNNIVSDIKIQSDDKILVTGNFTTFSGISSPRLIRLNSDGSYDPSLDVGVGLNSNGVTITLVSKNYALIGGNFTNYKSSSVTRIIQVSLNTEPTVFSNRLIRLNNDGSADSTFNIGSGFNSSVRSIDLQSDGKIITGGDFTTFNGTNRNFITKLNVDGTEDTNFDIGDGFDSTVYVVNIQNNDKILVGGMFVSYDGLSVGFMTRLNPNGSIDNGFDIGTGFNSSVYEITLPSEDKILVGGEFTSLENEDNASRFAVLVTNQPNVEIEGSLLFDNCEICNSFILNSNTEYVECLFCNGDALLVDAPHPVWTNNYGMAVTQLDAIVIGGTNGWNS